MLQSQVNSLISLKYKTVTREENRKYILLKMIDLIEDTELYLMVWRKDSLSGGTKGYALGACIKCLKRAKYFFEK